MEWSGRDSNLRPLGYKSDALTTTPPCHSTAYTEHHICTQRSLTIGGEVVDVPFGVIVPTGKGHPMGTSNPKICEFQNFFSSPSDAVKFTEFNGIVILEMGQKLAEICDFGILCSYSLPTHNFPGAPATTPRRHHRPSYEF